MPLALKKAAVAAAWYAGGSENWTESGLMWSNPARDLERGELSVPQLKFRSAQVILLNKHENEDDAEDDTNRRASESVRARSAEQISNGHRRIGESERLSEIAAKYRVNEEAVPETWGGDSKHLERLHARRTLRQQFLSRGRKKYKRCMKYAQHWRRLRAAQPRALLKETHLHCVAK